MELKKSGNELYLAGENLEAIKKYDQALETCPLLYKEDRAILLANKAAASIKMGQKEKAIEECSEALALHPTYVKALLRRGQSYEETDKPHEAMKDFEKVLEIDPGHKEARMAVMVRIEIMLINFNGGDLYFPVISETSGKNTREG